MKKILCLLLAGVLVLAMAACAAPQAPDNTTAPTQTDPPEIPTTVPNVTEPPVTKPPVTEPPVTEPPIPHEKFDAQKCAKLVGTWSTTVTLDNKLMNFEFFYGKTSFTLYYTFDENGWFRAHADKEEFETAVDTFEELVVEHMVHLRYISFKGQKEWEGYLSNDEINAMWQNGPEVEARNDCQEFVATLNLYYHCADLLREGHYYVEGGKLFTQLADGDFESSSYTAGKTSLTLRDSTNPQVYQLLNIRFPLILKAVEET